MLIKLKYMQTQVSAERDPSLLSNDPVTRDEGKSLLAAHDEGNWVGTAPAASWHICRVLVSPLQPLGLGTGWERVAEHEAVHRLIGQDLQSPPKPLL